MLCHFARTFPPLLAELLGRSKSLRRRFREETATELLLMGLLGIPASGVTVNFSANEAADGADMDWEMDWNFVSPDDPKGGSYVRVLIQAKVAVQATKVQVPYWYYAHLDYDDGKQATKLVATAQAAASATLPLYMMFHPIGALAKPTRSSKGIEGINLVAAERVHKVVTQKLSSGSKSKIGCSRKEKKVAYWQPHFFTLHDLLCWPQAGLPADSKDLGNFLQLLIAPGPEFTPLLTPAWHPDFVAERLNRLTDRSADAMSPAGVPAADRSPLSPQPIPPDLMRAVRNEETEEDRRTLKRTRVIFRSPIARGDPRYERLAELSRGRSDQQG